ncbi:Peptidase family S41 [Mucilaginibacter pineti]|uniref:Peptidase family S41 n=1 Tax=Mucilaginibacter pineti TaxID=1391627 RepID=A0A1G7L7S5_9SPHI|nr:S41 family peptidase [Mucilaginibacter pineti]SDF45495.1 Peptidase family S41 [Mucilaginibacter pineti]
MKSTQIKSILFFLILILYSDLANGQSLSFSEQIGNAKKLYDAKEYKNAAVAYSAANRSVTEPDPSEVYNEACSWALALEPDSAFKTLKTIVGISFFKYTLLTTDKDLTTLRKDTRWNPLLDKIKKTRLTKISKDKLYKDFDLLVSALKEAHTGLYWYNSKPAFDSICNAQRMLITNGMTALDFYNIVAPVVAFTKEGHTYTRLGDQALAYMGFSAKYFPIHLKFLNNLPFIINDLGNIKIKGLVLTSINGVSMGHIMKRFLSFEPSDGFNTTSKYRWIEENGKFSSYYAYSFPTADHFTIEAVEPATGKKFTYSDIPSVTYTSFYKSYRETLSNIPNSTYTLPAILKLDTATHTGVLTFNSFSSYLYDGAKMEFHQFVKDSFTQIKKHGIHHLVIDIRNNGGGDEGFEDYLLSYLITGDYIKYKYVQASAFSYSFYANSDYKNDWYKLEKMLKREHYLDKDGRILRKPGIEEHEKPQTDPFSGDLYILTSGLTYSGGSEFAALAKNYTNAIFIGEEAGGGYYGNTSGNRIVLKLPYSKLQIGIPLLKFVLDTPNDSIPFGHGVIPDYQVQGNITEYLKGDDAQMDLAKHLIKKTN